MQLRKVPFYPPSDCTYHVPLLVSTQAHRCGLLEQQTRWVLNRSWSPTWEMRPTLPAVSLRQNSQPALHSVVGSNRSTIDSFAI